ncbi:MULTISPECIES: type III secretion system stalk subunit SctO [unclassified Pseudomonas]|jgi:type III secretion protein O|uniref:type III secretion system stalk subunit SctO n=1 Tax=unclassified Pseudomonas TaxID=196821 RepID=UPI000C87C93F|nr:MULTISPECIES: YscO family type III secretion system apparatus protein [unclassified Pseudomonas]PMU88991.1 type III secretion protein [Pseudomonas sp. GW704-F5]PMU90738.1 type III secretion protein [Pseudomonas sp. GW704-F3]PMU99075.1 type III secretion protein [Pseudomonas sp. MPBD4-3]PMV29871.1 type III secretion protein [Pseudomonas sp. GW704-F2]
MSLSDVLPSDIDTLRRLRRYRADRAERALREAKRAHQTLVVHIQQAQETLEQTRQEEARQSAQLLSEHQGQVVTFKALKTWSAKEQHLSAGTRREESQLKTLQGQREEQAVQVGSAQKHVTLCLRQVEKIQELSHLLAQEPL